MKKLGFFGGSFNPPTYAHINVAKMSIEKFNLDAYLDLLTERKNKGDGMCCLSTKYPFYLFTNKIISTVK